mgnify:CR=1 FL=1
MLYIIALIVVICSPKFTELDMESLVHMSDAQNEKEMYIVIDIDVLNWSLCLAS